MHAINPLKTKQTENRILTCSKNCGLIILLFKKTCITEYSLNITAHHRLNDKLIRYTFTTSKIFKKLVNHLQMTHSDMKSFFNLIICKWHSANEIFLVMQVFLSCIWTVLPLGQTLYLPYSALKTIQVYGISCMINLRWPLRRNPAHKRIV